jgi:PAT family beta-lactamase induction signal transducer AmpG
MTGPRASTAESIKAALTSWRIGANALFSLSSGIPLGLVWQMVPAWMTLVGVDIKTIGVLSLAQAPWAFKFLWAPLFDRYRPRFLGGKRAWIAIWQVVLAASTGLLAAWATNPTIGAVAVLSTLIAFASASQDIAVDGYAVESLRPNEQGRRGGRAGDDVPDRDVDRRQHRDLHRPDDRLAVDAADPGGHLPAAGPRDGLRP